MDYKKIGAIVLGAILLIAALGFGISYVNEKNAREAQIKDSQVIADQLESLQNANDGLVKDLETVQENLETVNNTLGTKDSEIEVLEGQVSDLTEQLQAEEEVVEAENSKYVEDELVLGGSFDFGYSDKELEQLFDGQIEFADEDVDVEEFYFIEGVIAINGNDFEDNAYMTLQKSGIVYEVVFDDSLDTTAISDDETLEFDFLGNEIEVISWVGDEIVVSYGNTQFMAKGETLEYDGHTLTIGNIYEDEVLITVDEITEVVNEGDTEDFDGVEVFVESVMYDEENSMVKIQIAGEVETTIESGDEFEEDSIWNWYIDEASRTIGIELNTDFDEIDDDEDYQAIMPGGYVSLPNDFVVVFYDGITEEDYSDYDFELDEGYLQMKGDFDAGFESYDILYADASGIYEKDGDDYNLLSEVTLSESEIEIEVVGDAVEFDDVVVKLDLSDVIVNGASLVDAEDNYRNSYGMIFVSPEDSLEDEEMTISVPEEAIEASISLE